MTDARAEAHRSDIDGLRALAIVPVLLFHAHVPGWEGGFLGVDVFFVISGYLITRQLATSPLSGTALLRDFYERRARRLFPILFVVIVTTWVIAAGLAVLTPSAFRALSDSTVASLFFLQNVHLWRTSGYWQTAAELAPLTHLWSLAVEEQFYLLFPLLFVGRSAKSRRTTIIAVCAVLGVTSFIGATARLGTTATGAFYLLPYRAWEILAGSLVHLLSRGPHLHGGRRSLDLAWRGRVTALRYAAVAGITWAIMTADASTRHPGAISGVVVAGTAALIALPGRPDPIAHVLDHPVAQWIGRRSYGLYLWHFPLLVLARRLAGDHLALLPSLAILAAAIALTDATFQSIESPHRSRTAVPGQRLIRRLGAGALAIAACAASAKSPLVDRGAGKEIVALEAAAHVPEVRDDYAEVDFSDGISGASIGVRDRSSRWGEVVVWGDSHASSLATVLSPRLRDDGLGGVALIEPGCPAVTGVKYTDFDAHCESHDRSFPLIVAAGDVRSVVIFARWTLYLEGTYFTNHLGVAEPTLLPPLEPTSGSWATADDRRAYLASALDAEIDVLEQSGKSVILVYPTPELGWNPIDRAIQLVRAGQRWVGELDIPSDVFRERTTRTYSILDSVGSDQTIRIFPARWTCDTYRPGWCAASDGETLLYADDDHLSAAGLAPVVSEVVTALGRP